MFGKKGIDHISINVLFPHKFVRLEKSERQKRHIVQHQIVLVLPHQNQIWFQLPTT